LPGPSLWLVSCCLHAVPQMRDTAVSLGVLDQCAVCVCESNDLLQCELNLHGDFAQHKHHN